MEDYLPQRKVSRRSSKSVNTSDEIGAESSENEHEKEEETSMTFQGHH